MIATVEVTLAAGGQGAKIEDPHCHRTQAHLVPDAEANTNVRSGSGDQEQGLRGRLPKNPSGANLSCVAPPRTSGTESPERATEGSHKWRESTAGLMRLLTYVGWAPGQWRGPRCERCESVTLASRARKDVVL